MLRSAGTRGSESGPRAQNPVPLRNPRQKRRGGCCFWPPGGGLPAPPRARAAGRGERGAAAAAAAARTALALPRGIPRVPVKPCLGALPRRCLPLIFRHHHGRSSAGLLITQTPACAGTRRNKNNGSAFRRAPEVKRRMGKAGLRWKAEIFHFFFALSNRLKRLCAASPSQARCDLLSGCDADIHLSVQGQDRNCASGVLRTEISYLRGSAPPPKATLQHLCSARSCFYPPPSPPRPSHISIRPFFPRLPPQMDSQPFPDRP